MPNHHRGICDCICVEKMPKDTVFTGANLSKEVRNRLEVIAKQQDRTLSNVIERAINEYFVRHEQLAELLERMEREEADL
jgi:predicted transcriptional regulator